jgi:hypothetical protein
MTADFRLEAGIPGAQIGYQEGVLVVLASAAEVGLTEYGNSNRPVDHALLGQNPHLQG